MRRGLCQTRLAAVEGGTQRGKSTLLVNIDASVDEGLFARRDAVGFIIDGTDTTAAAAMHAV